MHAGLWVACAWFKNKIKFYSFPVTLYDTSHQHYGVTLVTMCVVSWLKRLELSHFLYWTLLLKLLQLINCIVLNITANLNLPNKLCLGKPLSSLLNHWFKHHKKYFQYCYTRCFCRKRGQVYCNRLGRTLIYIRVAWWHVAKSKGAQRTIGYIMK